MAELSLSNIVNLSVAATPSGVGAYNTSNLAIFSEEVYAETFGTDGYKIYLEPSEVMTDFGSSSKTYKMANAVFSQQPNILAGGGYLVVVPFVTAIQTLSMDKVAASGSFTLAFTEGTTAAIDWDDTASEIQTKIRAVHAKLNQVTVTGSIASKSLVINFKGYYGPAAAIVPGGSGLLDSLSASVTITQADTQEGETLAEAITRAKAIVQFFGILPSLIVTESVMLDAASTVQSLNKIIGFVSRTSADVETAGKLDKLRSMNYTHSRGLYYAGGSAEVDSLVMSAAYFGRGLSVNFEGSNTTTTMHLKELIGVDADSTMTQTTLTKCVTAGVDVYASFQGVAKVFTSGANDFFDSVYNLLWFAGALEVASANYQFQAVTKIPQTEDAMNAYKDALAKVCEQALTNQYVAPGSWTSPVTFGNQQDFLLNIAQRGYYMYSKPVAQQSQADRVARNAPLVSIAIKEAGAIHKGNIVVYINA